MSGAICGDDWPRAVQMDREAMRQRADFVGAHRVLTAAAGMSRDSALSASALEGLRRAQPGISLALDHARVADAAARGSRALPRGIAARGDDVANLSSPASGERRRGA